MAEERELEQLKKRLLELADRSYQHGIYTFTPFLGLSEQQAFYRAQVCGASVAPGFFGSDHESRDRTKHCGRYIRTG